MSTAYHLRPVSDISPSPSPTASATPPGDHSPHYKQSTALHPSPPSNAPLTRRRPMSPSSLRELDLSHTPDMPPRKYPAPPTGHDLMAMFPPAPPDNFEMRGPTSDYFKRQERAFFAQAGKEIVRVRVEVDFPHGSEPEVVKPRTASRPWPLNGPGPGPSPSTAGPHHSPVQSSSAPLLHPHPATRPPPRGSVPNPTPMFPPLASHTPSPNYLPPNHHQPVLHQTTSGLRTPPEDAINSNSKPEYATEEYDDEAWRKPMPYAERRRAGKHTRRVVVRS